MSVTLEGARIAIVGGGKMGEAIMAGLIASSDDLAGCLTPHSFVVAELGESRREQLEAAHGVACVADASRIDTADVVILAVKPQIMMDVIAGMVERDTYCGGADGPLFVSIAAGISTARLESGLVEGARVVRVMPNMPLQVGAGAAGVTGGVNASADDVELVRALFACLGYACVVEEDLMDAVCAVSGSGPAYVAAMVEAMRDAGVAEGLDPRLAEALALQTVYGTAKVMVDTGQSPAYLRESVCSPGGTTLAALEAMNEAGFADVFNVGVSAAVRRSKELGAC